MPTCRRSCTAHVALGGGPPPGPNATVEDSSGRYAVGYYALSYLSSYPLVWTRVAEEILKRVNWVKFSNANR